MRLQLGLVDPEGAARDLDPVDDQVVSDRPCGARVGVEQRQALVVRARERMVHRLPAFLLLVPLEQREIGHPEEAPGLAVDQVELATEVEAERAEHARDHRRLVGPEQHRRRRLRPERVQLGLREELCDRRANLALLVVDEIREALRAPLLGDPFEPLEVGARELLGNAQETDRRRVREDAELGAARQLRRVLDLEPEAQVGLVRSIARLRLVPGHPWERRLDLDAEAVAPDASHRLLHQREEELLVGERHLDVELRELLQAVGAEILVSEAARDLVVALEAGDDEQLLVDLRRLGQREEAARLQPRRDQEVAGALRRRLAHDRRLDVDEAGRLHLSADRSRPLARACECFAASSPGAGRASGSGAAASRRRPPRRAETAAAARSRARSQRVDLELDLAGRQVRVDGVRPPGRRPRLPPGARTRCESREPASPPRASVPG